MALEGNDTEEGEFDVSYEDEEEIDIEKVYL